MKNTLTILVVAIIAASLFSCKPTAKLPLREIDRPIVLTPKHWEMTIGGGVELFEDGTSDFMPESGGFIPYYKINDRFDFLYFPILRYHILKNDTIKDDILYRTGANWIVQGGLNEFGWGAGVILIGTGIQSVYKNSISENSWVELDGMIGYRLIGRKKQGYTDFNVALGTQLTNRMHFKLSAEIYGSNTVEDWVYRKDVGNTLFNKLGFSFGYQISRKCMVFTKFYRRFEWYQLDYKDVWQEEYPDGLVGYDQYTPSTCATVGFRFNF